MLNCNAKNNNLCSDLFFIRITSKGAQYTGRRDDKCDLCHVPSDNNFCLSTKFCFVFY